MLKTWTHVFWMMVVVLAAGTIIEYFVAVELKDAPNIALLGIIQVIEAGLIIYFFMHIYRLWRSEEGH